MEAILATVVVIIALIIYREEPKTPPSSADDSYSVKKKSQLIKSLFLLARNKNFLVVLIGFIFFILFDELHAENLSMLLSPFNVNNEEATTYFIISEIVPQ